MRQLEDIPALKGVPVLVRLGLNVPLVEGVPSSTFRLRRAFETLKYLQEAGARIIVISHIGRDPFATLHPVYEYMRTQISRLSFMDRSTGAMVRERVNILESGEILMLENLRRNTGEVQNDKAFAQELASLADVFVQDAFGTCHRSHASIIGVPELLPSYAGRLVASEVHALQRALKPKKPSIAIIGGVKFATKEPLIEKLLHTYDRVFIGGALGNDLLQARGYPVGKSVVSGKSESLKKIANDARIIGPVDVLVSAEGGVRKPNDVGEDDMILDAGPATVAMLEEYIQNSRSVLWNGPLGYYEKGFETSTKALARAMAGTHTHAVVGGGDTVAAIEDLDIEYKFAFMSTGGGAMLEFLTHGTLPGIEVLK